MLSLCAYHTNKCLVWGQVFIAILRPFKSTTDASKQTLRYNIILVHISGQCHTYTHMYVYMYRGGQFYCQLDRVSETHKCGISFWRLAPWQCGLSNFNTPFETLQHSIFSPLCGCLIHMCTPVYIHTYTHTHIHVSKLALVCNRALTPIQSEASLGRPGNVLRGQRQPSQVVLKLQTTILLLSGSHQHEKLDGRRFYYIFELACVTLELSIVLLYAQLLPA